MPTRRLMRWIVILLLAPGVVQALNSTEKPASTTPILPTSTKVRTTKRVETTTTKAVVKTTTAIDYYYYAGEEDGEGPMVDTTPIDPDKTAYGVIICVSGVACVMLLYMAVFGRRMRRTAIRWHVMNCSWWSMLHLASYGAFAEKAPWPNYIISKDWRDNSAEVECFTRSIFPCGMFFVYIETIVLTIVPRLANNWIFNLVFFILLIPVLNAIVIFCFFAQWMEVTWFYTPIDFLNLFTYFLFCIMTAVYFLFCLFGSCFCCFTIFSRKERQHSVFTFLEMWLLFPYALIPDIMYGPSFGMTSVQFVLKFFYEWILKSGILDGGGDMTMIFDFMTAALNALPWFVLFFPLVQAILAVICIKMFRQQFIFLLTCGRVYDGPALPPPKLSKQWASTAQLPPPVYVPIEPVKMEAAPE